MVDYTPAITTPYEYVGGPYGVLSSPALHHAGYILQAGNPGTVLLYHCVDVGNIEVHQAGVGRSLPNWYG